MVRACLQKIVLSILLSLITLPWAVSAEVAPVYQRDRGNNHSGGPWRHPGGYQFGFGYFGFPPQVYGGNWYQRPYPTHLDFFRLRSAPPAEVLGYPCIVDDENQEP